MTYLGIDIGGTKTAVAAASDDPNGLRRHAFPTPPTADRTMQDLMDACVAVVGGAEVDAVGVSFGGHVSGERVTSLHVPGWEQVPLAALLRDRWAAPVSIVNDGEAGAIAEYRARVAAGQSISHLVYATVSTGIGAAVITDGAVLRGSTGMTAELGHFRVADSEICSCGRVGHLEALASGTAIARRAVKALCDPAHGGSRLASAARDGIDARVVAAAADADDDLACQLFADAGRRIGYALATLALTVDPEVIVVGGGVAGAGDYFWSPMAHALAENVLHPVRVERAVHGPDSALMGALEVARAGRADPPDGTARRDGLPPSAAPAPAGQADLIATSTT